jgi:hypothetical protein
MPRRECHHVDVQYPRRRECRFADAQSVRLARPRRRSVSAATRVRHSQSSVPAVTRGWMSSLAAPGRTESRASAPATAERWRHARGGERRALCRTASRQGWREASLQGCTCGVSGAMHIALRRGSPPLVRCRRLMRRGSTPLVRCRSLCAVVESVADAQPPKRHSALVSAAPSRRRRDTAIPPA